MVLKTNAEGTSLSLVQQNVIRLSKLRSLYQPIPKPFHFGVFYQFEIKEIKF